MTNQTRVTDKMTKRLVRVIVESVDDHDPFKPMTDDDFGSEMRRLTHIRDAYGDAMKSVAYAIRRMISPISGAIMRSTNRQSAKGKKMHFIDGMQIDLSLIPANIRPAFDVQVDRYFRFLKKSEAAADVISQKTASSNPTMLIPAHQVPAKVAIGSRAGLGCAYHKQDPSTTDGQYAGDPSGYQFTPQMAKQFQSLSAILARNNLQFKVLYACRVSGGHINFQVTTGDGKFVWSKYDMGGGSGMNSVFLNGTKMKTSTFLGYSTIDQDNALRMYSVI